MGQYLSPEDEVSCRCWLSRAMLSRSPYGYLQLHVQRTLVTPHGSMAQDAQIKLICAWEMFAKFWGLCQTQHVSASANIMTRQSQSSLQSSRTINCVQSNVWLTTASCFRVGGLFAID